MPPKSFLFIRHGQTDWGPADITRGPLDLSLNSIGRKQAQNAFDVASKRFDLVHPKIFSSDLLRAQETAEIFANNISPKPKITSIPGLNERYYGDYSKLSAPDDAETSNDFAQRVQTTFRNLFDQMPTDQTTIIISHQKVFEYLTEWLTGNTSKLEQGGVCYFKYGADGTFKIV